MKKMLIFACSLVGICHAIPEISTKKELDNLMKNHEKVVVEFYSPTCPHCVRFNNSGIFESLAKEFSNIAFVRANVNAANGLFKQYGIHAFPSFIIFKDGQPGETHEGGLTKAEFKKML